MFVCADVVVLAPYENGRVVVCSMLRRIKFSFPPGYRPKTFTIGDDGPGVDDEDNSAAPCDALDRMVEAVQTFSRYYYGDNSYWSDEYRFSTVCSGDEFGDGYTYEYSDSLL